MANIFTAYALFILMLAAPFLIAALLLGLLWFGIQWIVRGSIGGDLLAIAGGIAAIALAVGIGTAIVWRFKPAPVPLPRLILESGAESWSEPVPRAFVNGNWDVKLGAVQMLLDGHFQRVLSPRRWQPDPPGQPPPLPEVRRSLWEEYSLVDTPECRAILADPKPSMQRDTCLRTVPLVVPDGVLSVPYVERITERARYPRDGETAHFYLVDGDRRQLYATCHVVRPTAPLPIIGLFVADQNTAVSRAYGQCLRDAVTPTTLAAALGRTSVGP